MARVRRRSPPNARSLAQLAFARHEERDVVVAADRAVGTGRDDLRDAARPALRHRLILNFEAQAEGVSADSVIGGILEGMGERV